MYIYKYIYMSYMLHISIHCFSFCDSHPLIVMFPVSKKCTEFGQGVFSKYPQKLPSKPQKTLEQLRFQGKRDKWEGSIKKHKASIDGKFDAFKTRSMCRNFRGTTIKTDANHGIQVQNYHHHTAPPSPSPNHLQYPSSNTEKPTCDLSKYVAVLPALALSIDDLTYTRRICSHGSCPGKSCCFMCSFMSYFIFLRQMLTFHT